LKPVGGLLRCRWSFESLFQVREVGRHLLSSLAADNEWDEKLADALTLELDRNRESRSVISDGFDGEVDDRADGSVDASDAPRSWRIDPCQLGRDGTIRETDPSCG